MSVVRNKKPFGMGAIMGLSFLGVLLLIFSPVFGGKTGLDYADDSFNKLAKGSSYFIPKVSESVAKHVGTAFTSNVKVEDKEQLDNTAKLFTTAGATVETAEGALKISGDLGTVLQSVVKDADSMYNNDGATVSGRYGYEEKQVMKNWWAALGKMEKGMKKEKLIAEAKVVGEVNKKAVEPGYNFYKIEANKVSEHAGMLSGLLMFYILYTLWWGYAIFNMFEGMGLTMKKSKVKKEA